MLTGTCKDKIELNINERFCSIATTVITKRLLREPFSSNYIVTLYIYKITYVNEVS